MGGTSDREWSAPADPEPAAAPPPASAAIAVPAGAAGLAFSAPARARPEVPAAAVLRMQRAAGNRAVTRLLARIPDASLPTLGQGTFGSCGASSLLTALMYFQGSGRHELVLRACNAVLTFMDVHRGEMASRRFNGRNGADAFAEAYGVLADARQRSENLGQDDYVAIAHVFLYAFSDRGDTSGLTDEQIFAAQHTLGLYNSADAHTNGFNSWDQLFTTDVVTSMAPGRVAQVNWISSPQGSATGERHDFLIGRQPSGDWFLSDQAQSPDRALVAVGSTPMELKRGAELWGTALYRGQRADFGFNIPASITLLADAGLASRSLQAVPSGTFIGEVDAHWYRGGDRLYAWDYLGTFGSMDAARQAFEGQRGPHGGLIAEAPAGQFSLIKTNPVTAVNVRETSLDESDSGGGLGQNRRGVRHAWLILATASGVRGQPWSLF